MLDDLPGRAIITASWVSNAVFLAGSLPLMADLAGGEAIAAAVCLTLFTISLGIWVWAFAVAASRSRQGDDIAVGSLFLVEGQVARPARNALAWSFVASLVITAIAASANPFAVLVPMLSVGLVGLWGARFGEFPRRRDVEAEVRPLRPVRSTRKRGGPERRMDG